MAVLKGSASRPRSAVSGAPYAIGIATSSGPPTKIWHARRSDSPRCAFRCATASRFTTSVTIFLTAVPSSRLCQASARPAAASLEFPSSSAFNRLASDTVIPEYFAFWHRTCLPHAPADSDDLLFPFVSFASLSVPSWGRTIVADGEKIPWQVTTLLLLLLLLSACASSARFVMSMVL